ncbi:MAG: DUF4416 family protein [Candidatus Firestonebacteria bacterium]|nr:DUF4416 family protein [Candidatus Firestonebacteria bacterium]
MGEIRYPVKAKLVIPVLYSSSEIFTNICKELTEIYGDMDYISPIINFNFTDFYNKEMGIPIFRIILSFQTLIDSEELLDIKVKTNELEKKSSVCNERKINLDPGYLDLSKFVLATTKNYSHRIHLGKGIFAECTLVYRNKTFMPWEWTYMDYRSEEYINIFNKIRKIYKEQIERIF